MSERLVSLNRNSLENRAKILKSESINEKISEDSMCINSFSNDMGYRSVIIKFKQNMEFSYYEATILSDAGSARIGFATKKAEINGPIGMDAHGYSFGSKNGYLFNNGKRIRFGEKFSKNEVVSCICIGNGLEKRILFFVNGRKVGKDVINLNPGKYYPAFSLYGGCVLSLNSGPFYVFRDAVIKNINEYK